MSAVTIACDLPDQMDADNPQLDRLGWRMM
jgi:hypothetical protein